MKRIILLISLLTFPIIAHADGKGARIEYKEKEWLLCITDFDVKELPSTQSATAYTIERSLSEHLNNLDYKLRSSGEYDYYWMATWLSNQSEVAKKLAAKQAERDKLYFQGYAAWRYKRELKRINGEITKLRDELENAELNSPNIATIPKFTTSADNQKGIFPTAPQAGREAAFCKSQKVNGFLRGSVKPYHNRLLVEIDIWTLWSSSYIYKDHIVFSLEDIDAALYEFSGHLINSISGMKNSVLVVKAAPPTSVIIVDDQYIAGNGETTDIIRTPGPVAINVYAKDHEIINETIKLNEGERTEIGFTLQPIPQGTFKFSTKQGENARVYQGALFVGNAPLALTGPLDGFGQIAVETEDNKKGEYRTAQTVFQIKDNSNVVIAPKPPAPEDRIEKARKRFYGAYGRFWVGLPVALMLAGMSNSYVNAWNASPEARMQDYKSGPNYNSAYAWANVPTFAWIGIGLLAADAVTELIIYIYQANRPGAILSKREGAEKITTELIKPDE
jgi:hypothetical protein